LSSAHPSLLLPSLQPICGKRGLVRVLFRILAFFCENCPCTLYQDLFLLQCCKMGHGSIMQGNSEKISEKNSEKKHQNNVGTSS